MKKPRKGGRRKGWEHAQLMKGKEKAIVRRFRAEALNGRDDSPLAKDMEGFLESRETLNYSPRTLESLKVSLRHFLLWADRRSLRDAEAFTRPVLESYQRHRPPPPQGQRQAPRRQHPGQPPLRPQENSSPGSAAKAASPPTRRRTSKSPAPPAASSTRPSPPRK